MNIIEKLYFVFNLLIRLSLIIAFVGAIYTQNWIIVFITSLTFILTFLPYFIKSTYKIKLPLGFEVIIILFVYAALFLGEVHKYYTKFWWWDIILHTSSGIAFGFIGFIVLFILYKSKKIEARPITIAIFSFTFAVAIGAIWEIFEFSIDQIFNLNMQKSGLTDTMWDLIVNTSGALIASISGFFYIKLKKIFIVKKIVKSFVRKNPGLFRNQKNL